MSSKLSSVSLSIGALLILTFLSMANVHADHHAVARNKNFQEYCIDYYTPRNGASGAQCEPTKQACDQRLAEYQARSELEPSDPDYLEITSDGCYKADVGKLATVYCIDYYTPRNGASGSQCEPSIEACEQRLQEYQARSELDPSDPDYLEITNPDTCYRHDKEYVNFSEHPYLRQYQR